MESGDTHRPVSASTWASSSVTVDAGRSAGSSPEVFLSGGEGPGAGCRPASPLRHHLAAQQLQQQPRQPPPASSSAALSPAGRGANSLSPTTATTTPTTATTAVTPSTLASTSSDDRDEDHVNTHRLTHNNAHHNEDDLLPMPTMLDSNAPKSLLCIWAFVRSFFVDLFSILFNPVWLLLTMFTVGEVIVVDAFIVFGPKYIQTVFNVDASSANILSGMS